MKALMIGLVALLIGATSAHTAFVSQYTAWQEKSERFREGYVSGMVDWLTGIAHNEPVFRSASQGLIVCGNQLQFRSDILADAITDFYKRHTDRWVDPPAVIFWEVVVRGVCLSHVNKERAALGLDAMEKAE
jgi:hypothetical protein